MSQWMRLNGGYLHRDKVELRASGTGPGRGLFARQEIYRGECIAVIPMHMAITEATADGCADIHSLMASLGMEQFWDAKIALFLLLETWRPPNTSYWSPFLASLPACPGLLLFAPPAVKLALTAPFPQVLEHLRERERHMDSLYVRLFEEQPEGITVSAGSQGCGGASAGLFGGGCWSNDGFSEDTALVPNPVTNAQGPTEPPVARILATEDNGSAPPPGMPAVVPPAPLTIAARDDVRNLPRHVHGGGDHVSVATVAGGRGGRGGSINRGMANYRNAVDRNGRLVDDASGNTGSVMTASSTTASSSTGGPAGGFGDNESAPVADGSVLPPTAVTVEDGGGRGGGKQWQGRVPSLAEWRWAMAIVHTRAFLLRGYGGSEHEACLIPVADMLNHSADRACCVIQDPLEEGGSNSHASFTAHASYGTEDGWKLIASRRIDRGEQLFMDYGCGKLPEDYLVSYGFLPSYPPVERDWSE
eukprot:jgi/Mesvir1/17121/Mv07554-RA.1